MNVKSSGFAMLDLFDLVSPRVYVISDSEYKEYKERQNKKKVARLEEEKKRYLLAIEDIDKELEALK